ncbi:MAG: HAMP domain-containing histidine kinase [Bacteroidetes bacterium]|nr:HAMP domain-containing histidine kinase [Bacteroidota bacterium]
MKLLNKTIRPYMIYSLAILLVTIPIFYFVFRSVLLHSVDRSLRTQLHEIRANLFSIRSESELSAWSKLDKDISLTPATGMENDSIYTVERVFYRHHRPDAEPLREISGIIEVGEKKYKLIISSSLVENEDLLGSILAVLSILVVFLIVGLLWINYKISKTVWKPFYVALNNMQQYELNKNTKLPFKDSNTDEFNELNQSIRHLYDKNYQIYLQQKEFTENASHEMQTPLAIFQSKLELLMQTSPLTELQASLIDSLENANQRLIRLNKSLVLLSKIENSQYTTTDDVNLVTITNKIIEQYSMYADQKSLSIRTEFKESVHIKANQTLIEILISNIISNAIRHNIPQGEVFIEIDNSRLIVQNTGVTNSLSPEKIFERFHKENVTDGTDGIGLGLAIAKKICDMYSFKISYRNIESKHLFEILF